MGIVVVLLLLIKGYLCFGVKICGVLVWDFDFNCVDFLMLFCLLDINVCYVCYFLG